MTTQKIKWGILGLGRIAEKFAVDLQLSDTSILQAVASRDIDKARIFSKRHNSVKYYSSYMELAKDIDIDVVYVATPHAFHLENTMMCLKNGKSVLCEKPLGMNSGEVKTMIKEAESRKLFLMEGIWTRFVPATEILIDLLRDKVIGDLIFMRADFGFKSEFNPEGRVYNKALGGGSLLDVGIYPVYLSLITLGLPTGISAMVRMTQTGVDSYCAMLFDYENSSKAILESSIEADTPTEAYIYGTKGVIKLHKRFHHTEKISLTRNGELTRVYETKNAGYGYLHEIEEVNTCLRNNETESSRLPHILSSNLSTIMDMVKDKIGLRYDSNA